MIRKNESAMKDFHQNEIQTMTRFRLADMKDMKEFCND